MDLPAASNQTDGDGGEQERDQFRDAAQTLLTHPARETIGVAKRDGDDQEIHQQRCDRVDDADTVDQDEQRREQRGPGDEWHAQRNHAEFVAAAAIVRAKSDKLPHGQHEQDQATGHLKIGDGDPERGKNNFPEKDETDRDAQTGEDAEKRLMFALLTRGRCAQPHENRDQTDGIDGDEERDEGEEKFLDHRRSLGGAFSLYRPILLHNDPLSDQPKLCV